jgi:hypothetical protein
LKSWNHLSLSLKLEKEEVLTKIIEDPDLEAILASKETIEKTQELEK